MTDNPTFLPHPLSIPLLCALWSFSPQPALYAQSFLSCAAHLFELLSFVSHSRTFKIPQNSSVALSIRLCRLNWQLCGGTAGCTITYFTWPDCSSRVPQKWLSVTFMNKLHLLKYIFWNITYFELCEMWLCEMWLCSVSQTQQLS